jgi:hypothetical protein
MRVACRNCREHLPLRRCGGPGPGRRSNPDDDRGRGRPLDDGRRGASGGRKDSGRTPAARLSRAHTLERALGRVLLIADASRFGKRFLATQLIEPSDEVIPELPRGGLVRVAQLIDPECHGVVTRQHFRAPRGRPTSSDASENTAVPRRGRIPGRAPAHAAGWSGSIRLVRRRPGTSRGCRCGSQDLGDGGVEGRPGAESPRGRPRTAGQRAG